MSTITPVAEQDYDALSTFLSRYPDSTQPADHWRNRIAYWWDLNPACSDQVDRGWLIKNEGEIVGFLGNVPTNLQINGALTTVYNGTTWWVLPEFRGRSLELFMRLIAASKGSVHFNTTATERVRTILERLKFERLPLFDGGSSIFLTSLDKVVRAALGRIPPLAALGESPPSAPGQTPPMFTGVTHYPGGLEVRKLDRATEEFDQLWEESKSRYDVTNVRTSQVLNWYCFANPNSRKELFACHRRGELLGYLICWVRPSRWHKTLTCLDLWVSPDARDALRALILAARQYAKTAKCGVMVAPHFSTAVKEVCSESKLRIQRRLFGDRYFQSAPGLLSAMRSSNCYFVTAQGDYSH